MDWTENGKRLKKRTYSCEKHNCNRFEIVRDLDCVLRIVTTISVDEDALRVVTMDRRLSRRKMRSSEKSVSLRTFRARLVASD